MNSIKVVTEIHLEKEALLIAHLVQVYEEQNSLLMIVKVYFNHCVFMVKINKVLAIYEP